VDAFVKRCEHCKEALSETARGRPQIFCSDRCRQAHRKIAPTREKGLRYRTGRVKPKTVSEPFEVTDEFEPENLSLKTSPLRCERVNDSTFKITNGELTNVPASHGQWSGYRTTKAVAWISKLEADAWIARCGDQVCGPSSFSEAKANALALAKGADGDYFVRDPLSHLNGLQARLLDTNEVQQVSEEGIFTKWQPQYAERRIATFPVKADKKPAIRRWNQITLKGSSRLAERFHESDAFGFQLGPKSQITALDVDSRDEAVLADALTCHGDTPFIVRTGGGYHAYYSYGGERRHIRPYHNKPIDILGSGFVVAPPSISERGTYQIIAGTLDDLTNLPPIQVALDNLRAEARIPEGRRNNTLFRFALEQARHSDTFDALLDVMRTRNMDCEPPLPDDVIISTAKSAWRYEQAGRNLVGRGRSVLTPHSVIDELIGEHQDATLRWTAVVLRMPCDPPPLFGVMDASWSGALLQSSNLETTSRLCLTVSRCRQSCPSRQGEDQGALAWRLRSR
jgi:hypothetical protein